jgi:hypothetical protein
VGVALSYIVFRSPRATSCNLALFFALSTWRFCQRRDSTSGSPPSQKTFNRHDALFLHSLSVMFLSGRSFRNRHAGLAAVDLVYRPCGITDLALSLFLKGVGMGVVWPHATLLAAFMAAIVWIALTRFRRSLA